MWLVQALALGLAACASTGPAPVEDRSLNAPPAEPVERSRAAPTPAARESTYKVQRGDTLYSIAFRHGLDYRELAGWNGVAAPYTILIGQELRLAAPSSRAPARSVASRTSPTAPVTSTASSTAPPAGASPSPSPSTRPAANVPKPAPFEDVANTPAAPPPAPMPASPPPQTPIAATPSTPVVTAPSSPKAAEPPPPAPPPTATPQTSNVAGEIAWRWPADGQVVGTFVGGDQTKQGIDVAGKAGDPVRAAAAGSVVYSGNGLIGYGELIIVKHSPGFLSAYGHNRKRLVKEGDKVSAGQVIAEMGSSSASRDSLHFEIRKNGKPANPLDYLPRR